MAVEMEPLISPSDDQVKSVIENARKQQPSLGIMKLLNEIKAQHPGWALSEKRFRKLLQTASSPADDGNTKKEGGEETTLVAETSIDASLDVALLAPKVKVKMFGGGKGKGLVAKDKISQGEVLWQEDPWIITADTSLQGHLSNRQMCSQCFLIFSQPNPPLSVCCNHCDSAHFCNRLCLSRARQSTAHLDLLCPAQNPGAEDLLTLILDKRGRHLDAVSKMIALWLSEREWGDAERAIEVERRVWTMARVNLEKKESEKKEWELVGETQQAEWQHAHAILLSALNPPITHPNYEAFTKLLNSRRTRKAKAKPLSSSEIDRWFSYGSFLELLGLASLNQEDSGGLYSLHSHINHSCEPNLQARNLPKSFIIPAIETLPQPLPPPRERGARVTNRLTIIAKRTIHPGEELCITYCNPDMPRSQRRRFLRENYGFWCCCQKCKKEESEPETTEAEDASETRFIAEKIRGLSMTGGSTIPQDEAGVHVHGEGCSHEH